MEKKDFQTPQMGIEQTDYLAEQELALLKQQYETEGMNLHPQDMLLGEYLRATKQLQRIFEVRRSELTKYPDDLPTSFVAVEREISKCISE